jgi:hypothetical protein
MDIQKVAVFDLSNIQERAEYERILNKYEIIKTEFGYMRTGEPKVTIWYIVED